MLLLSALPLFAVAMKPEPTGLRKELTVNVDLSTRKLVVKSDGKVVGTYDVTVGKAGHETPTGSYKLSKVVWNPSWTPPDSKWADTAEAKEPGERGNPMGRVKIFFEDQLYIHGTAESESLGEPASHGCIRMSNAAAMRLARLVMEHGGAGKSEEWYASVKAKPNEAFEVTIPTPPVLEIRK
jgi:lipoprotein-anchoring transpeptidase ErfK/SrfK